MTTYFLSLCVTEHRKRYFRICHATAAEPRDTICTYAFDLSENDFRSMDDNELANHALQLADFSIEDWLNDRGGIHDDNLLSRLYDGR